MLFLLASPYFPSARCEQWNSQRRPALYMIPSRQNTEDSPRQVEFAVWMLERALDLTGPGVE